MHVVLQNQEPSHSILKMKLPKHLEKDGPFLVPVTESIWNPIKVCRLCHDFYGEHGLFDDDAKITRGTVVRPAESVKNYRQSQFLHTGSTMGDGGKPNRDNSVASKNDSENGEHVSESKNGNGVVAGKTKDHSVIKKKEARLDSIDTSILDRMEQTSTPSPIKGKRMQSSERSKLNEETTV